MMRFNPRFSVQTLRRAMAAVIGVSCILGLVVAWTDLNREMWNRDDLQFVRWARISFDFTLALFSLLGLAGAREIPISLRQLLRQLWRFYRTGMSGLEGMISGIPPGDTAEKLRLARPLFRLESHTTPAPPRILAAHCPMCHEVLVGYPQDMEHCPKCGHEIIYLHRELDSNAATTKGLGWLPRRVGEFLRNRYGQIRQ
jgi:hypothetical protein